ncbi:hypothetical protein SCLCIDRAFT_158296 [Scleroderma citrinum Foug A]|uniref:Uncharacterized protein n=1 Tax=Scleroderma citrinum Foug A TaxID=1036808 RepID=A0A0C3B051_9AGAM|nr:hypothetical protein SCLCIDRAFT_158296 [Scleroderma citrinum Foug A]
MLLLSVTQLCDYVIPQHQSSVPFRLHGGWQDLERNGRDKPILPWLLCRNFFCKVSPSIDATCTSATAAMSISATCTSQTSPKSMRATCTNGKPIANGDLSIFFYLRLLVIICPSWSCALE